MFLKSFKNKTTDIIIQKTKMSQPTYIRNEFDENMKSLYFEKRNQAYNNPNIMDIDHGLLFRYIRCELISRSPMRHIHNDRLYDLQTIYYNQDFRRFYECHGLNLQTENGNMKSKDAIILELYFYDPN